MNRIIGELDLEETPFGVEDARRAYRDMVRARRFNERAIALQRRGWMSGFPSFEGQEASQVGAAHAMAETDWLFPTYRSNAMQIALDVPMSDLFLFRRGHQEFASGHELPVFPQAVPIATQIPHAAGVGMAANYTDADHAALCYLGDGATSEGDFHEGLNFAGVFEAPVVFFCENNGWAISLPRERQTASDTIAEKAEAYGFSGVRVDGNDPLAVRMVVEASLEQARETEPVLVESLTFRRGAHTTSDDPSRYRDDDPDHPDWRTADPIARFETYCREQGAIDDAFVETVYEDADAEVGDAIETAETEPAPEPGSLFEGVYAEPTPRLAAQREALEGLADRYELQELDH